MKSLLLACVVVAIVAVVTAPLARRISFGSGAIITLETDTGSESLVGIQLNPLGQVVLVLLLAVSALGLAWFVSYRRRKMRN